MAKRNGCHIANFRHKSFEDGWTDRQKDECLLTGVLAWMKRGLDRHMDRQTYGRAKDRHHEHTDATGHAMSAGGDAQEQKRRPCSGEWTIPSFNEESDAPMSALRHVAPERLRVHPLPTVFRHIFLAHFFGSMQQPTSRMAVDRSKRELMRFFFPRLQHTAKGHDQCFGACGSEPKLHGRRQVDWRPTITFVPL